MISCSIRKQLMSFFEKWWKLFPFQELHSDWFPTAEMKICFYRPILFECHPQNFEKNFTESWKFFKGLENLVLNRKCMWWLTFEIKIRINNYFPPCRALCILRCRFNEHHFVKERFKNSFFDDAGQPPFARINLLN